MPDPRRRRVHDARRWRAARCRSSSSASPASPARLVLTALDAGAVDFVQKPTALASDRLLDMSDDLVEKVKAAARARPRSRQIRRDAGHSAAERAASHAVDIVVIGISTGGPQALEKRSSPSCRPNCRCRSRLFCTCRLATLSSTRASSTSMSAADRAAKRPMASKCRAGIVSTSRPAGRHLTLRRNGARPGHDPPRRAAARYAPPAVGRFAVSVCRRRLRSGRVLGIVMTGMGADGREGSAWIKAKGGTILTEAEDTLRRLRNAARRSSMRDSAMARSASTGWQTRFSSVYDAKTPARRRLGPGQA